MVYPGGHGTIVREVMMLYSGGHGAIVCSWYEMKTIHRLFYECWELDESLLISRSDNLNTSQKICQPDYCCIKYEAFASHLQKSLQDIFLKISKVYLLLALLLIKLSVPTITSGKRGQPAGTHTIIYKVKYI